MKGIDIMTQKKETKRELFAQLRNLVIEINGEQKFIDFIDHEIELLSKKNGSEKKPTATQIENKKLAETIYNAMEENTAYTITEISKLVPELDGLQSQKVTSLVYALKKAEKVTREEIKGKAYFTKN